MPNHQRAASNPTGRHGAPDHQPRAELEHAAGPDDDRNFWARPSDASLAGTASPMTNHSSAARRFERALAIGNPRLVRAAAAELPRHRSRRGRRHPARDRANRTRELRTHSAALASQVGHRSTTHRPQRRRARRHRARSPPAPARRPSNARPDLHDGPPTRGRRSLRRRPPKSTTGLECRSRDPSPVMQVDLAGGKKPGGVGGCCQRAGVSDALPPSATAPNRAPSARVYAAGTTIARFRQRHETALAGIFGEVLALCSGPPHLGSEISRGRPGRRSLSATVPSRAAIHEPY